MSISYEWLFGRYCLLLTGEEEQPGPEPERATEVVLAFAAEDDDLACTVHAVLERFVRILPVRLGEDNRILPRVRKLMAEPDRRLIALLSAQTTQPGFVLACLETAYEVTHRRRVCLLHVRIPGSQEPAPEFACWPHIEAVGDGLRIFGPNSSVISYPLEQWFRRAADGQQHGPK